jgi:hypothetical protein
VLLAVAAVATAWASYQSARWHGKQAQGTSLAARVESTRASNLVNLEAQVDIGIFTQWINAYAAGNRKLAAFCGARSARSAGARSMPGLRPGRARTLRRPRRPFAMPRYKLAASAQAARLESRSETFAQAFSSAPLV